MGDWLHIGTRIVIHLAGRWICGGGWMACAVLVPALPLLAQSAPGTPLAERASLEPLRVGVAVTDITPPVGFPMAGYFHERLADGTLDPLHAKAIVFQQGEQRGALVLCDLIGVAVDLTRVVRQRASAATGIPAEHIALAATHSHTAPDYAASLYQYLAQRPDALPPSLRGRGLEQAVTDGAAPQTERERLPSAGAAPLDLRGAYIERLIAQLELAIVQAAQSASPAQLLAGSVEQTTPVSFNRRFVQGDGTIKTWIGLDDPNSVRVAGPIDPAIGLMLVKSVEGSPRALLSNFALHLDTVGGIRWSADYPFFIEQSLQRQFGSEMVSLFGTGCCGDINHVAPRGKERNKTEVIGAALAQTILAGVEQLPPLTSVPLTVRAGVAHLPLQAVSPDEVSLAVKRLQAVDAGQTIDFYEHVTAHKQLLLDQLTHAEPLANAEPIFRKRRVTHTWAGVGATLPADIQVFGFGEDLAIVCVPGEVFVELGLAIKQASPFRQTMIIELANCVETCYVPTRAACVGGGYEPTNSTLQPGAGEMLVAEVIRLLQLARSPVDAGADQLP